MKKKIKKNKRKPAGYPNIPEGLTRMQRLRQGYVKATVESARADFKKKRRKQKRAAALMNRRKEASEYREVKTWGGKSMDYLAKHYNVSVKNITNCAQKCPENQLCLDECVEYAYSPVGDTQQEIEDYYCASTEGEGDSWCGIA